MKLGRLMRRRRSTGGGTRPKIRREHRRVILMALATLGLGSGAGYLYATQLLFPAPRSSPSDFYEVPDLRGMSGLDAETFLQDQGLQVGAVDSISHPDIGHGIVLGQTPLPGQLALPAGPVGLTLSLGPERRPIPDVTRLRVDRALTVLETSGFDVMIDSMESDVLEGRIVSTFPEAGVVLPLPAQVLMSVSLGPPMVSVPILAGLQEEAARVLLDSLGLAVGEVETRFRFGFNQGEVLEHFPPADSLIPAGTEVRLVIGRRGFF